MFPGQGSQAGGMGVGLFPKYRKEVATCDEILGYSIEQLCLEDPQGRLRDTRYTQPAVYVVNALSCYDTLGAGSAAPDYLLGHSLGEMNALLAAGCFDFETGLRIVCRRAELMSLAQPGGMAAIGNTSEAALEQVLAQARVDTLDMANFNAPSQIVISGPSADLARVRSSIERARMVFHPLNTSGAFHSRYMRSAGEAFERFVSQFELRDPAIPVIANVSARPYAPGSIARNLGQQLFSPVQWSGSVDYLRSLGEIQFVEIGHGDVLKKIVHTILKQAAPSQPPSAVTESGNRGSAAHRAVAAWNRSHPPGTQVSATLLPGEIRRTRTEAVVLFGHRPAIYLEGYRGYFDLNTVAAAGESGTP